MTTYATVCFFCKHYGLQRRCSAFREKLIPAEIWFGKNDHREPVEGDNGIQFELREDIAKRVEEQRRQGRIRSPERREG